MNDLLLAGAIVAVPAMLLFAVAGTRRPALAVCVVPLSFPIEQLDLNGLPIRVVQLSTVAAIALVALHQRAVGLPLLARSPVLFAVALVVLSALVSTVVSLDPMAALRLDAGYLLGLALAVAIALACRDRESIRLVIWCVCGVGTVICVAGLRSATDLRAYYGASVVDNRATGLFGQPNELGAFAALMVVLGLSLLFSARRWPMRLLSGTSVLIAVAALVASLSRSSWIGVAVGVVAFVVLAPGARRAVIGGILGIFATVAVAVAVLPSSAVLSIVADRAASLVDGRRNPYDARPSIWREALRQIVLRPILGSGPGGYPVLAARGPSRVTTVRPDHAHDLALTVAAEQGLLGVLALTIALAVAGVAVVRTIGRYEVRASAGDLVETPVQPPPGTSAPISAPIAGQRAISQRAISQRGISQRAISQRRIDLRRIDQRTVWQQPALPVQRAPVPATTAERTLGQRLIRRSVIRTAKSGGTVRGGDGVRWLDAVRGRDRERWLDRVRGRDAVRGLGIFRRRGVPRGGWAAGGERELFAGIVAALAVVLGQGLLDYPLRNPVLATMVWLLLGLLAAVASFRAQASHVPGGQHLPAGQRVPAGQHVPAGQSVSHFDSPIPHAWRSLDA